MTGEEARALKAGQYVKWNKSGIVARVIRDVGAQSVASLDFDGRILFPDVDFMEEYSCVPPPPPSFPLKETHMPPTQTEAEKDQEGAQLQLIAQLELIDVDLPQAKAIKKLVGPYQKLVSERKLLEKKEKDARQKLVAKVREVGHPNRDGTIGVKVAGFCCVIKPDEKVKITFEGEEGSGAVE